MLKLDHIPNEDKGDDYLDPNQLNTELRLQQKLESIQVLWSTDLSDDQLKENRSKSWQGTIEAIERDITFLNNDYKYKRLVKLVEKKYGQSKIDTNDLYKMDYQANGPWRSIAGKIHKELQSMASLRQKN